MGDLIQIRDYQQKRDKQALEQQAIGIVDYINGLTAIPYGGAGIDGMTWPGVDTHYHQMYQAPEKDPA